MDIYKLKDFKVIKGENRELLGVSDALILASGTVALEACILEVPMIIAYRGPILFYLIYLLVRSIKKSCLVNIITGKDVVEEFLMFDVNAKNIANSIKNLLYDKDKREKQIASLKEAKAMLQGKGCVLHVAEIINREL